VAARSSARDRLLAAADELFYEEGIHTVGIDRVIERAGVAKASLYSTFGSKDELVRAYLNGRHARRRERITRRLAEYGNPRDRLLGVFDIQGDQFAEPGFHGCAFVNATAESAPGSTAEEATLEYRGWMRNLFTDLARDTGVPDPGGFAGQLLLLYDGANISARIDRNTAAAASARAAAATLLDAATAP
jgi:AcrR family transcriptional regulator